MRSSTALAVALALVPAAASPAHLRGQICGTGHVLLKNDNLPAVPGAPTGVSVIRGLCEGEACAAVFDFTSVSTRVQLHEASIGFFAGGGAGGNVASVDVEAYDGITWSGGIPTLGPRVFSWKNATGASLQVTSHGINTTGALTQYNITASSGKLVVAWWMEINPSGTCAGGYPANFGTDNNTLQFTCTPSVTPPQRNLLFIAGQGWRDASTATVSGVPLCPFFYSGNWVARVCVEAAQCPAPVQLAQGTAGSGGRVPTIAASGGTAQVGNSAFAVHVANSLAVTPGILLLNAVETPVPFAGGTVFVLPGFAVSFFLGGIPGQPGGGAATIPLPIPANPALAGARFTTQAGIFDAAAVQSIALTPGLRVPICP